MSFINSSIFKNMAIKDANKEIVVTNTDNSNNVSFHSSSSDENVDTVSIKNILNKASNMDLNICSFNNNILSPVITINNNNKNCVFKTGLNMNDNIISNVGYPDANGDALNLEYYNDWTPTDLGDMTDNDKLYTTKKSYVDTGSGFDTSSDLCLEIGEESSISSANDEVYPIIKIHPPYSTAGPWLNYVQDSSIGGSTVSYLGWAWNNQAIYEIDSNKNFIFHGNIQTENITTKCIGAATGNQTAGLVIVKENTTSNYHRLSWYDTVAHAKADTGQGRMAYIEVNSTNTSMYFHLHPPTGSSSSKLFEFTAPLKVHGIVTANGTVLSSDDRLKINEELIQNATNTLLKLRPQIYDKKEELNSAKTKKESGLIVQEIYYEAPELRYLINIPVDATLIDDNKYRNFDDIRNDPDYSNWGTSPAHLNYTGLITYLIQGFKEQNNEINTLKTKVSELENKNIELETKLNDLYSIVNELKTN